MSRVSVFYSRKEEEFTGIGRFVDEIIEELGIEEPSSEADFNEEDNIYEISVLDRAV
ncbi:MAG: hypothetical protein ACI9LV_000250 [Candidatus Nanohaloarchaea archaeon]|jgi:hypothetical protein